MSEHEGYLGIQRLLLRALSLMEPSEAKELVLLAAQEVQRQAKIEFDGIQMGMELGRLFKEEEDRGGQERRNGESP